MLYGLLHTTNTVFSMEISDHPAEALIPRFTDTALFIKQKSTQKYFLLQKNGFLQQNDSIVFENPKNLYANPEKMNSITSFIVKISNEKHYLPIPDKQITYIEKIQKNDGSIFCAINDKEYRIRPLSTKPVPPTIQSTLNDMMPYVAKISLIGFVILLVIQTFNPLFIHKVCLHFY
jgi:hypothetical protein